MAGTRNRAKMGKTKHTTVTNDDGVMKELPSRLASSLMPFQREGVLFAVRKNGRCLIADEMGLGKTLQAIAVASYFQSEWPLLIIVPSSLRYAWIEELEKWLPDILPQDINLIQGGLIQGNGIADAKITIVTYGLLSCKSSAAVKEALQAQQFKVAICDESHYFKNSRTECCKAVTSLLTAAKRCLLLTGTPALARPSELFTQMDVLLPGKFGSFWSFTKKYCAAHWEYFGRRRQWRVDGASNLDELQQQLGSVMIRREKSSVLTQLPPKQRQKILFPLKDSQTKKEILSVFAELKPLLKKSRSTLAANLLGGDRNPATAGGPVGVNGAEQRDTNILSRIQRLYNLTGEAKIGPARDYIQMLCENVNLKFLVFAYHHSMMDGLQQTLWDKKVKFVRIDGHTRPSDRQLFVQQFQNDKDTRVAILSILAAGVGLTLTAASVVVFTELYWTPGVMIQCEDRAHRIGQTSTVAIHYLVARETMDEWVWSAVCKKTLVTTTALTGKTQALQADAGESYQVELLSAAESYTPAADNAEVDAMELVQSQLPQDQRSILDFFCSQTQPSQPSSHSSNSGSSGETGPDLSPVENGLAAAAATPCNKDKKPFPLFTVRQQSGSKPKSSQDSIIISSSEEEEMGVVQKVSSVGKRTKATSVSRKRKCVVIASLRGDSDSEFEQTLPVSVPSEPKKLKFRSKSKPKASAHTSPKSSNKRGTVRSSVAPEKTGDTERLPGESVSLTVEGSGGSDTRTAGGGSDAGTTGGTADGGSDAGTTGGTAGGGSDVGKAGGKEWSCSACTFANSSLLPFCEICETPRKQKRKADLRVSQTPNTNVTASVEARVTVESPACLTTQGGLQLTPALCSGAQVSKQSPFAKHDETLAGTEQVTDGEDSGVSSRHSKSSHLRQSSRRVKRNLLLSEPQADLDLFQTEREEEKPSSKLSTSDRSEQEEVSLLESPQSNSHSVYHVGGPEANSEESNTETLQQESDKACSPRWFESGDENEGQDCNKTVAVGDDDVVSLSSSPESGHSSDTVDCRSRIAESGQKTGASHMDLMDTSLTDNLGHESDNEVVKVCCSVNAETAEIQKCDLPEVKPPKRRCFMLDTHTEESTDTQSCQENREGAKSTTAMAFPGADEAACCTEKTSMQAGEERGQDASGACHLHSDQQLHSFFSFCCSSYTGRVYIFDESGQSLKASFLPLDVELDNVSELPELLHHHQHLRLVQNFVRQWNSLTDTKQRLISKRGLTFHNPLAAYDTVRTDLANNKQRYQTKEDQAKAALKAAREVNGNVRVLSKQHQPVHTTRGTCGDGAAHSDNAGPSTDSAQNWHSGYVQVMSAEGTPLCLHCQQPCSALLSKETLTSRDTAWHTRFCSKVCADAHWMKTNTSYLRNSVYDIQHGVCQLCNFDAHTFFCQIRDSADMKQRAERISKSRFDRLGAKQKKQMVAKPYEGLFWHVDHVRPVWDGGGQCDIDNLRTLCTPCHQALTAQQAAKRAQARRLSKTACAGDITAFFKKA